ncbi:hypothetical protein LJR129_002496 [Acidovorax sp. LjRoot129]|uniref:hypothetical protein n=1 Tax=Acidovorax sp. LjRoot129 TaxID=3342260 RepID=UPI003ECC5C88
MSFELLLQLAGPLGVGVGVYAAIRSDLARISLLAQHAHESAGKAHERIDRINSK